MAPASLHGAFICMAPASLHGAFICMAPSSLQGALINGACSLQSALIIGTCSLQGALASPCARGALHPTPETPYLKILSVDFSLTFSITSQLPHERGVPKETLLPSSSRSCEPPLSTPSALRLGPALKTPIWKSPETFGVTRSARRTKPHTTALPTAHSPRSARHLQRDPPVCTRSGHFSRCSAESSAA